MDSMARTTRALRQGFVHLGSKRKAGLAFVLTGTLTAGSGFAIGLGEVENQSALGAPLDVEIELSLGGNEPLDEVHAKLADSLAYEQAGLDRKDLLNNTRVDVIHRDGRIFLHVVSPGRVGEPYVPLLLEVASTSGTVRREYDLLLDPPANDAIVATVSGLQPQDSLATEPPPSLTVQEKLAAQSHEPAHVRKKSSLEMTPVKPQEETPVADGFARVVLNYPLVGLMAERAPQLVLSSNLQMLPSATQMAAVASRFSSQLGGVASSQLDRSNDSPIAATGLPPKMALSTDLIRSAEAASFPGKAVASQSSTPKTFYVLAWLLAAALGFMLLRKRQQPQYGRQGNARGEAFDTRESIEGDRARSSASSAYLQDTNPRLNPPATAPAGTTAPVAGSLPFNSLESPTLEEPVFTGGDFFSNVAEFLKQTVEREPHRLDLRMKLLEVYFTAGRAEDFIEQAAIYLDHSDHRSDAHWPEIVRMGLELSPGNALFVDPPKPAAKPVVEIASTTSTVTKLRQRRYYEDLEPVRLELLLTQLGKAHVDATTDGEFQKILRRDLRDLMQRPSALQHAVRLSSRHGGAAIYLKREDQHGARDRELINAIGQINLAQRMGKTQVVAGTLRSGNHAIAVATVAAKKGMRCHIYASETTLDSANIKLRRLKELAAEVSLVWPEDEHAVDPRRAALKAWIEDPQKTQFICSLSAGPSPYPSIVLDFQTVVGQEVRRQLAAEKTRRRPDALVASAYGGFETFGLFAPFIGSKTSRLYSAAPVDAPIDAEPTGDGALARRQHWQSLNRERAWLHETGRVALRPTTYEAALMAVDELAQMDGLKIAVDDGYALACATDIAASMPTGRTVVALLGAAA